MKKGKSKSLAFENYIIKVCEGLIDNLKPSIKDRVIFRFSDEIKRAEGDQNGQGYYQAMNIRFLEKDLITIYPKVLVGVCEKMTIQQIKDVITHELVHCFTPDEKTANEKVKTMNFFK